MGTPSDPNQPDFETGNACAVCSAAIFLYNTPKYVRAKFIEIDLCPGIPPTDLITEYILRQDGANPCKWFVGFMRDGILWECWFYLDGLVPPLECSLAFYRNGAPPFYNANEIPCQIYFANMNDCDPPEIGRNGYGAITWGPEINENAYDAQFV